MHADEKFQTSLEGLLDLLKNRSEEFSEADFHVYI